MTTGFNGFGSDTFSYLRDLRDNNNKEWFNQNRGRYEEHFLTPAIHFVTGMEQIAASLNPPHRSAPKINGSIRRIHRDVRFSKDKTPYDARMHLVFWTGDHPNRSAAIHFVLHPESIGYGAGQWALSSDDLDKYRKAIVDKRSRGKFLDCLESAKSIGCEMGPAALKRLPKGYDTEDGWADLLKHKAIVTRTHSPVEIPETLTTDRATDYVTEIFRKLAPLNAWINKALG